MLKVENLNVYYGMIHAIKDISLEVQKGEIVSLVGANGAGKTTTLQAISGMLKPKSGKVEYLEHNLLTTPSHKIVQYGLAHVPEGRRVFAQMTVLENLEMGAFISKDKAKDKKNLDKVFAHFPRLEERKKQLAGTLDPFHRLNRPNMLFSLHHFPIALQRYHSARCGLSLAHNLCPKWTTPAWRSALPTAL